MYTILFEISDFDLIEKNYENFKNEFLWSLEYEKVYDIDDNATDDKDLSQNANLKYYFYLI